MCIFWSDTDTATETIFFFLTVLPYIFRIYLRLRTFAVNMLLWTTRYRILGLGPHIIVRYNEKLLNPGIFDGNDMDLILFSSWTVFGLDLSEYLQPCYLVSTCEIMDQQLDFMTSSFGHSLVNCFANPFLRGTSSLDFLLKIMRFFICYLRIDFFHELLYNGSIYLTWTFLGGLLCWIVFYYKAHQVWTFRVWILVSASSHGTYYLIWIISWWTALLNV